MCQSIIRALKYLIVRFPIMGKFVDFQYLLSQLRNEYDGHKTGENILYRPLNIPERLLDPLSRNLAILISGFLRRALAEELGTPSVKDYDKVFGLDVAA